MSLTEVKEKIVETVFEEIGHHISTSSPSNFTEVKNTVLSALSSYEKALKEELREKIRNMPKENFGTNQYEAKYVLWKSCLMRPNELGVDDFLSQQQNKEK